FVGIAEEIEVIAAVDDRYFLFQLLLRRWFPQLRFKLGFERGFVDSLRRSRSVIGAKGRRLGLRLGKRRLEITQCFEIAEISSQILASVAEIELLAEIQFRALRDDTCGSGRLRGEVLEIRQCAGAVKFAQHV